MASLPVLMQVVQTRMRLEAPLTRALTACRLTFQRRRETLCAWRCCFQLRALAANIAYLCHDFAPNFFCFVLPGSIAGEEDKVHITFQYLIRRQTEENGITDQQIEFTKDAVSYIIRHYTREAGVRSLERQIRNHLPEAGAPHRRRQARQAGGYTRGGARDAGWH